MTFQVTIVEKLSYDIEVEADDFNGAVDNALNVGEAHSCTLYNAALAICPKDSLTDTETEVVGVYKL